MGLALTPSVQHLDQQQRIRRLQPFVVVGYRLTGLQLRHGEQLHKCGCKQDNRVRPDCSVQLQHDVFKSNEFAVQGASHGAKRLKATA